MEALPAKQWTVLVYQGGVNNLDANLRANLRELASAPPSPTVDVLVRQVDAQGTSRDFRVENQQLVAQGEPRADTNSADPAHLAEFIRWGMARFPARHYALVVSSHGRGADGVIEDERKGQTMPIADFARALQSGGRPFDLLLFDACRMQTVEVASELRGRAQVVVASMDRVGSQGFDPKVLLAEISQAPTPDTLGRRLVEHQESRQLEMFGSLSAVDIQQIAPLEEALGDLAEQLRQLPPETAARVRQLALQTRRSLPSPGYLEGLDNMAHSLLGRPRAEIEEDLKDWLQQVHPAEPVAIHALCQTLLADGQLPDSLRDCLHTVLEAEQKSLLAVRGEGLSLRLPIERQSPLTESTFDQATGWQQAVDHLVPPGTPAQMPPSWLEQQLG